MREAANPESRTGPNWKRGMLGLAAIATFGLLLCAALAFIWRRPPNTWRYLFAATQYEVRTGPRAYAPTPSSLIEAEGQLRLSGYGQSTPETLASARPGLDDTAAIEAIDWLIGTGHLVAPIPSRLEMKARQINSGPQSLVVEDRGLWVHYPDAGLFPDATYDVAVLEFRYERGSGAITVRSWSER